ncbi:hypothetical protein Tco_0149055 [Tanacetum coccineum]
MRMDVLRELQGKYLVQDWHKTELSNLLKELAKSGEDDNFKRSYFLDARALAGRPYLYYGCSHGVQSTNMAVLQKTPEHKDKTSLLVVVGRHKRRHWIDNQFYNLYEICIFELSLANTTNLTLDKVFSIKTQDQSTSASAYPTTTGASSSTAAIIPESVKGQEQLQKEKEETRSEQEAREVVSS